MARIVFFISLLVFTGKLAAVELFGLDLAVVDRNSMRTAIERAGITLIKARSGADFDVYDSQAVVSGTSVLYLGFARQQTRFAFAEYEFRGIKHDRMRRKLEQKYGKPEVTRGKYISDNTYSWKQDDIEITLVTDWPNYKTRLSYIAPDALVELKKKRLSSTQNIDQTLY